MKNILVITDFTEAAVNILRFANKLAFKANAELVLLHCTRSEELTATAESRALLRLRSFAGRLQNWYPTGKATVVHNECLVRSGSLVSAITDLIQDHHIDLILMPATLPEETADGEGYAFLRTLTQAVTCPIMMLPPQYEPAAFKHIVYAADLTQLNLGQLKSIIYLASVFKASLDLVHVYKPSDRIYLSQYKNTLKNLCSGVEYAKLNYFLLEEEDRLDGVNDFAQLQQADLLIFASPDELLMKHLCSINYLKTKAYHQQIPVMLYRQPVTGVCPANCTVCGPQKMRKPNLELVSI